MTPSIGVTGEEAAEILKVLKVYFKIFMCIIRKLLLSNTAYLLL